MQCVAVKRLALLSTLVLGVLVSGLLAPPPARAEASVVASPVVVLDQFGMPVALSPVVVRARAGLPIVISPVDQFGFPLVVSPVVVPAHLGTQLLVASPVMRTFRLDIRMVCTRVIVWLRAGLVLVPSVVHQCHIVLVPRPVIVVPVGAVIIF